AIPARVPANRQINSIRMPECHVVDVGTRKNSSADLMQAADESVPIGWLIGHAVASLAYRRRRKGPPAPRRRPFEARKDRGPYLLLDRGAGLAGEPVVAGASSGIHVIALRSYLKPLAFLSRSLVAFMTRSPLLLFLFVPGTALKGTATSFSPIPRKPPTPTMSAVALPSRSTSTSMISPILLSLGSYTFCLYQWVMVTLLAGMLDMI